MGARVQGSACRVQQLRLQGSGCRYRVQALLGVRVQGSGCRVQQLRLQVSGCRYRVQGAGFVGCQGSGFRVQISGSGLSKPLRPAWIRVCRCRMHRSWHWFQSPAPTFPATASFDQPPGPRRRHAQPPPIALRNSRNTACRRSAQSEGFKGAGLGVWGLGFGVSRPCLCLTSINNGGGEGLPHRAHRTPAPGVEPMNHLCATGGGKGKERGDAT